MVPITQRESATREAQHPSMPFQTSLHPLLKNIYKARGITSDEAITYTLNRLQPFNPLKGIQTACSHLSEALKAQKRFLIVGDFDADGATSCALAVSALQAFGAEHVDYLVPNRFEYGYGLTPEIVEVATQKKPDIIITVDNGISSLEGVQVANTLGISVIITDHHLPGKDLPPAAAIVNPNQPGDEFSSKHLAGVGVIFYVMLALRATLRDIGWFKSKALLEPNMAQFLDLVALGTVADVVQLDTNNRILVHQGLKRLRARKTRPGLIALMEIANRNPTTLTAKDLGFSLAPRLNAAGRLEDMSLGIACLLTQDLSQARVMATQLDSLNRTRRQIQADMQKEAHHALKAIALQRTSPQSFGVCLFNADWHQGVIGILAGRLKDKLHRPVAVFTRVAEGELKASLRSIAGLHIRDLLETIATQHENLLLKFGGHAMAAGLSLREDNYARFCEAFNQAVQNQLDGCLPDNQSETDGMLSQTELSLEVAEILKYGGPWGQGFPEPLFEGIFLIIDQRIVGDKHLKMVLKPVESSSNKTTRSSVNPAHPNDADGHQVHPDDSQSLAHDATSADIQIVPHAALSGASSRRLSPSEQTLEAIAFNVNLQEWPNARCQCVRLIYSLDVNEFKGYKRLQLLIKQLSAVRSLF